MRSADQPVDAWKPSSFQLFNLAFGVAVGVGWIVVVGNWLADAGPLGTTAAFAVAGLAMLAIGVCYAEVGTQFPGRGGEVQYALSLYGGRAAFALGWFLALAYVAVLAFELVSLAWIARTMWPQLAELHSTLRVEWGGALMDTFIAAAVLAVVVGVNVIGPKSAARLQDALVIFKLVGSCALVALGIAYGHAEYWQPLWSGSSGHSPVGGFFSVLATAPFFFAGFGAIAQAVPDIGSDLAKRRLSLTVSAVIVATALFYILIVLAVAAAAPRSKIVSANLPAAEAFTLATQSTLAGKLVLVIGFLGLVTILNGIFFSTVRVIQRIGTLEQTSPTPPRAIGVGLFVAAVALVLSLLGQAMVESFLALASASISVVMTVVCVCALLLRIRRRGTRFVPTAGIVCGCAMSLFSVYGAVTATPAGAPPPWLIASCWTLFGLLYWRAVIRSKYAKEVGTT